MSFIRAPKQFHPDFNDPGKQPSGPVEADPDYGVLMWSIPGGPNWGPVIPSLYATPAAPNGVLVSGTQQFEYPVGYKANALMQGTVIVRQRRTATAFGTNARVFEFTDSVFFGTRFERNGTNGEFYGSSAGSGLITGAYDTTGGAIDDGTDWKTVVISWLSGDEVLIATSDGFAGSASLTALTTADAPEITFGNDAFASNSIEAHISFTAHLAEYRPMADVIDLAYNPYQVLQPATGSISFIPAGAAPSGTVLLPSHHHRHTNLGFG